MMRRVLLSSGMVAALAAVCIAAAPGPGAPTTWSKEALLNSPLARMISGCIGRLLVLRSEVNLTDEQKTKICDVLLSHRPQIAQTAKSVFDKKAVLRNAVLSGKSDETQIRAAADELGKAIADAAVKASKLRNEIAPILTEDQCKSIDKFLGENDAAIDKFLENASQG